MKNYCSLLLLLLLLTACPVDRRESLFEINYEPITFTLPAGEPSFQTFVVSRASLDSRFDQALVNNNVTIDQVDEVGGFFARLTATSGEDFRQLRRVDIRICPVEQVLEGGCTEFDVLFSADDLFGRRQQTLRLNPSLRNFLDLVAEGQFRFELVLSPAETTSANIDCRLEWGIRGVGVE